MQQQVSIAIAGVIVAQKKNKLKKISTKKNEITGGLVRPRVFLVFKWL
jgi:hypothetical protein